LEYSSGTQVLGVPQSVQKVKIKKFHKLLGFLGQLFKVEKQTLSFT